MKPQARHRLPVTQLDASRTLAHTAMTSSTNRHTKAPRSKVKQAQLELMLSVSAGKKWAPFVQSHLLRAHTLLKPALRELSVALVGDARMSRLHQQFMGIAGPTDVLTFPLDEDDRGRCICGEVVICVPEAGRNARSAGTPIELELLLYAIHGMLHLSGFDDRTASDFERMHRKEDAILTQLGLGPVFGLADARVAAPKVCQTSRATRQTPVKALHKKTSAGAKRRGGPARDTLGVE